MVLDLPVPAGPTSRSRDRPDVAIWRMAAAWSGPSAWSRPGRFDPVTTATASSAVAGPSILLTRLEQPCLGLQQGRLVV
jgi:hypothetical protein